MAVAISGVARYNVAEHDRAITLKRHFGGLRAKNQFAPALLFNPFGVGSQSCSRACNGRPALLLACVLLAQCSVRPLLC